jgi:hypothetical protein
MSDESTKGSLLFKLRQNGEFAGEAEPVFTQTYATASTTHPAMTSADMPAGGTGIAAGGWSSAADRDTAIADFAELRADVIALKQLVNALIDNQQTLGLAG